MISETHARTWRNIGVVGEAVAAGGVVIAMAIPRFYGDLSTSGLSQRAGFNVGWLYIAVAVTCLLYALQYFLAVRQAARGDDIHVNMGGFIRDILVFFAAGMVAGLAFVQILSVGLPVLLVQFKVAGLGAMLPTMAVILVPLLVLLLSFRIWVPRWASDLVVTRRKDDDTTPVLPRIRGAGLSA